MFVALMFAFLPVLIPSVSICTECRVQSLHLITFPTLHFSSLPQGCSENILVCNDNTQLPGCPVIPLSVTAKSYNQREFSIWTAREDLGRKNKPILNTPCLLLFLFSSLLPMLVSSFVDALVLSQIRSGYGRVRDGPAVAGVGWG